MHPFEVWVIVLKDREGKSRGFEKCTGEIFYSWIAAFHALTLMENKESFQVHPCIIMGKEEWDISHK
jgi:hypothetical protein